MNKLLYVQNELNYIALLNLPATYIELKKRFGTKAPSEKEIINAYQQFVGNLRNHYPKAGVHLIPWGPEPDGAHYTFLSQYIYSPIKYRSKYF